MHVAAKGRVVHAGSGARSLDSTHTVCHRLQQRHIAVPLRQRTCYQNRCRRFSITVQAATAERVADAAWSSSKLTLLRPLKAQPASSDAPLLVYLPGSDGTGQAITPQLPGLYAAGFDVRSLFIPLSDRSSWDQLADQTVALLRQLLSNSKHERVTIVGESFGGCLALRVALAAPELLERMVLVNPATCFARSLGGLSSLIASTNLLSLFPSPLYTAAQAVLVPMLLDRQRVDAATTEAVKNMMLMAPPSLFAPDDASASSAAQLEGERAAELFLPSATANWRLNLLRSGGLPETRIAAIEVPVLLVASAEDMMLPSLEEASRLQRLIPSARRVVLPDSGHTALLEAGVDLAAIMQRSGIMAASSTASSSESNSSTNDSTDSSAPHASTPSAGVFRGKRAAADDAATAAVQSAMDAQFSASNGNGSSGSSGGYGSGASANGSGSTNGAYDNAEGYSGNGAYSLNGSSSNGSSYGSSNGAYSNGISATGASSNGVAGLNGYRRSSARDAAMQARSRPAAVATIPADPLTAGVLGPGSSNGSGNGSGSGTTEAHDRTVQVLSEWAAERMPDFVASIPPPAPSTPAATIAAGSLVRQPESRRPEFSTAATATAAPPAGKVADLSADTSSDNSPVEGPGGRAAAYDAVNSGAGVVQPSVDDVRTQKRKSRPTTGRWSVADQAVEGGISALAGWRRLISPVVSGVEVLPDPLKCGRPLLFVGNHTQFGLYDLPMLVVELYLRGYRVRGLADPRHWLSPLGPMFEGFGAVKASPMAAARLLRQGEAVLLFPGGAREVAKRKGEKYKLFWREDRADFVRLAAKFNALIVPFAAVGGDDAFDLFMDTDEILATPVVGDVARRLVQQVEPGSDPAETVPPIATIPGLPLPVPTPVPIPNFARLYFRFLEPIDTAELNTNDEALCNAVYENVRSSVEGGMAALQGERLSDPKRDLGPRLRQAIGKWLPAFDLLRERRDLGV